MAVITAAPVGVTRVRVSGTASTAVRAKSAAAAPVRITRRGRLVVTALAACGLTAAIGLTSAFISPAPAIGSVPTTSYVVQSGDTLWSIAAALPNHGDIRSTVDELRTLNPSSAQGLVAGSLIRVPRS